MKLAILLLFILVYSAVINAQEKYLEIITDDVYVQTLTYATKDGEDLAMDIYLPGNDARTGRATIIYVHGGGFMGGARDGENLKGFCTKMAKHGYVVASISYRLTRKDKKGGFGCNCPAEEKINAFNAAVEDLHDATSYLVSNRKKFRIDTKNIIIAGSSAGAETVLNAAYQPPFRCTSRLKPVSYAGVIGMAGAIPDTAAIYSGYAIPSLFFHGTDDKLVPYATAPHHYCKEGDPGYLVLHGSYTIAQKLEQMGVPFWLHTGSGAGHEMANTPMTYYFDVIVDFCYHFIIKGNKEPKKTFVGGK